MKDKVYYYTMGRKVEIQAIALSDDHANELCSANIRLAVIGEKNGIIYLANKDDLGEKI